MKDLHLHLSGATSPVLLYEMINETGLKIKTKGYYDFTENLTMRKDKVKSLDDYLQIIHIIDESQSSPMAVEKSFYDSYKNSFLNGCDYLELRWNPYKRSQDFKIDLDRLILSARTGFEKANYTFGITGGMILTMGRDCTEAQNEGIFKKAIQYYKRGIIGIDVAGPESRVPLKDEFFHYYKTANALGLMTTIHAGEPYYEGVDTTLATIIEKYEPNRIGHGIQIVKFPELMKKVSSKGIELEICISSNLMTQSVKDEMEFFNIFKTLEDYQIKYTICTDAVYSLNTNIRLENEKYKKIMELRKNLKHN